MHGLLTFFIPLLCKFATKKKNLELKNTESINFEFSNSLPGNNSNDKNELINTNFSNFKNEEKVKNFKKRSFNTAKAFANTYKKPKLEISTNKVMYKVDKVDKKKKLDKTN